MAFGNVGIVWAVFNAYRDHRIFEMLELLHEEVIWVRLGPDGPTEYQGHDGVRKMLTELRQANSGYYTVHLDDVFEDEPGLVIAKGTEKPAGNNYGTKVMWRVQLLGGLVSGVETVPG